MDGSERSPKRRRFDQSPHPHDEYSSPDELAAPSDHDHRYMRPRTSLPVLKKLPHPYSKSNYKHEPQDDSPDELDDTPHAFYRDNGRLARSPSIKSSSIHSSHSDHDRELTASPEPAQTAEPPQPQEEPWRNYKLRATLEGHRRGVSAVKFSPDGRFIASCCAYSPPHPKIPLLIEVQAADATIRIWDTATGKPLHLLEGHLAGISTIAWSPDCKVIASGSDDKSIRLWNACTVCTRSCTESYWVRRPDNGI